MIKVVGARLLCMLTLLLALCFSSQIVRAQEVQDTTRLYQIKTTDGNKYIGHILDQNEEFVLLKTRNLNEITIAREDIVEISLFRAAGITGTELWPENLQSTRYFWAPNGYGLRQGEGYYQNIWIFFNQASIGVTDNFSIGLGTVPLFMFGGTASPFWITPKFSIPLVENNLNVGVGAFAATVVGSEGSGFGILYGITTLGTRNRNASLGVGYGFSGEGLSSIPTFTASGMLRVNRKWYLLTENYFINVNNETFALTMFGGRVMFDKFGLDFGLIAPYFRDIDRLYTFPWLGFTVPFGKH